MDGNVEAGKVPKYTVSKHTEAGGLEKVGAIWEQTDKNGKMFLSIKVGDMHLLAFPFEKKEAPGFQASKYQQRSMSEVPNAKPSTSTYGNGRKATPYV